MSFWERAYFDNRWTLTIVGAGLAGLNLALSIKERDPLMDVRVLEAGTLSYGASTKNAGFFCFGSPSEILDDIDHYGEKAAFDTVQARWKGLQRLKRLFSDASSLEVTGGHELFRDPELLFETRNRIDDLNDLLEEALGFRPYSELSSDRIEEHGISGMPGGFRIEGEGMLDPYHLHRSLLNKVREKGVEVLFGAKVEGYYPEKRGVAIQLQGADLLRTQSLVLATNGFTSSFGEISSITPARGQVLITEPLEELSLYGTFHMEKGNYYFRNVGNRLLLGGGRELDPKGEATSHQGSNLRIRQELERILIEELIGGRRFSIADSWSGIMGFTRDKTPRLEAIGYKTFLLAGFSGMGVALSFSAGERMAEKILEDHL
ncbi:MAG: NAD(P)/FAD-dependent oxidoreductase [Flavobacteriales bacterium]